MRRTRSITRNWGAVVLILTAPVTAPAPGETFVVTSIEKKGPGTLRQALLDAQNGDTITFDTSVFPPAAPVPISLTRELPGLSISSNNNTIRGLQIVGFSLAGIALNEGAQNNTIGGDRNVGTGPGGTTRLGDFSGGVFSDGANHTLIVDNLIGGDVDTGVRLSGVSGGYNTVRGNYIGTDTSGSAQITYSSSVGVSINNSGHTVVGPSNRLDGQQVKGRPHADRR